MESFRPAWKDEAAWEAARASVPPPLREEASARFLTDPRDTTSAEAALNFLNQLAGGTLLSRVSTSWLLSLMSTTAGLNALRRGLPANARLAQQSGASPTDLGLTPAANAMGVVTLPNHRRFALVAFLAGSTATAAQRDDLIAQAARLAVSALS
jgi:beta-lactamase class A